MNLLGKIDYKGLPEHGRTLPVVGRRTFLGIDMVVLDNDGYRLALPAEKVAVVQAQGRAA